MTTSSFSTNGSTNGVHHAADEAIDTRYAWMPGLSPAPQPCPEALFSLTLRGTMHGQDAMITVRAMTPAEFQRNLTSVKGLLDPVQAPASPPAPTQGQGDPPQCPTHGALQRSTKGKGWYCPHKRADDTWCPSKGDENETCKIPDEERHAVRL